MKLVDSEARVEGRRRVALPFVRLATALPLVLSITCAERARATPPEPLLSGERADSEERGPLPARNRLHVGVERLFGVSLYSQQTTTETDFGDFTTLNQGVVVHLFGASAARGDGRDGKNLSAMPRLYVDYEWQNGWTFGGMFGGTYSTGRRRVENDDTALDPFEYPSQVVIVGGVRLGRILRISRLWGASVLVGPGIAYEQQWGGSATSSVLSLQINTQVRLFIRPTTYSHLFLAPYADIGFYGTTRQKLNVSGIPGTVVTGRSARHGLGIAGGAGWVF